VYADGKVKTFNGDIVSGQLTMDRNLVATVGDVVRGENDDPCKFFLSIHATDLVNMLGKKLGDILR
jgi:hypothetical protein